MTPTPTPAPSFFLHRFAIATVAATLLLLVAGGQVTSTQTGDTVPTWPFPILIPGISAGAFIELGHRHVAGLVAAMTGILAIATAVATRRGRPCPLPFVRRVIYLAFGLVLLQAGLGGARVLLGAAVEQSGAAPKAHDGVNTIAVIHASIAQAFLLLIVTAAAASSPVFQVGETRKTVPWRRWSLAAVATIYAQIVIGAVLRHTTAGLVVHVVGALAVLGVTMALVSRVLGVDDATSDVRHPAMALAVLVTLQVGLGILATSMVTSGLPKRAVHDLTAIAPTAHLLVGGMILATAQYLLVRSGRVSAPPRAMSLSVRPQPS